MLEPKGFKDYSEEDIKNNFGRDFDYDRDKYEVEDEKEWDDEEGHFEIRYYTYDVQICIKE